MIYKMHTTSTYWWHRQPDAYLPLPGESQRGMMLPLKRQTVVEMNQVTLMKTIEHSFIRLKHEISLIFNILLSSPQHIDAGLCESGFLSQGLWPLPQPPTQSQPELTIQ
jgi:hypothetical protein